MLVFYLDQRVEKYARISNICSKFCFRCQRDLSVNVFANALFAFMNLELLVSNKLFLALKIVVVLFRLHMEQFLFTLHRIEKNGNQDIFCVK